MELALVIYGIEVISNLRGVALAALYVVPLLVALGYPVYGMSTGKDPEDAATPYFSVVFKPFVIVLAIIAVVALAAPSKSTMYAMLAAYGGQSVVESEAAQRLAPKSLELLEGYIDKHLAELEPSNE